MMARHSIDLKSFSREELSEFVTENLLTLLENEALAILDNRYCTTTICGTIARNQRLTGFYSVRLRLVAHRATPLAHSTRLVHFLYWFDLLRLSVEMTVPPTVRRAIDVLLVQRAGELALGERISSARRCSHALIKHFLFDPHPRVFEALLMNQRLREEDLVLLASSPRATVEQIVLLANDPKWSFRYAIRKALVMNAITPRAVAASQLRYLTARDRHAIQSSPETSVYLRRCIENLERRPPGRRSDTESQSGS